MGTFIWDMRVQPIPTTDFDSQNQMVQAVFLKTLTLQEEIEKHRLK